MMKNTLIVVALSVAAFAGCKKGGGAAGGADCAGATAAAMKAAEAETAKLPEEAKKLMSKGVELMTKMCTEGKWSADITTCIKAAKGDADMKKCMEKLTPDQQKQMADAAAKMMQEMMKDMPAPGAVPPPADGSAAPAPAADGSAAPAAGSAAPAPAADGSAAAPAAAAPAGAAPAAAAPAGDSAAPAAPAAPATK